MAVADTLLTEVSVQVGSRQEATWIIEHARTRFRDEDQVAQEARRLALRRATGEPLQYVLGTWSFRSIELAVSPAALIPRPETEQLVEATLRTWRSSSHVAEHATVVDLGTGTGAIGLSLALELGPATTVDLWLTDRSPGALSLAGANATTLGVSATLRSGSWFDALDSSLTGAIDLLVSNPPYVAARDRTSLDPVLRHEPDLALFSADGTSGEPGFGDVEHLLTEAPRWLAPGAILALEMSEAQVATAVALARRVGLGRVDSFVDLAGRPRGIVAVAA